MKKIVELEANSAQENGADGKSDSKQKKRTNSISWNILKLAEKEENVANFKKINANEKRSIKKIYETLCREITEVSMRKVEDIDKAEKVMLELAYECVFHAKSISALEDGDGTEIDLLGRTIVPIGFYVRKFKFGNEEQCIGFRNIYCATLKSMMIYVVEYAGSVLQKKQKEISQKDKVLMAYEIVCNYVKSRYKEYYEAAFDEKNKIKLDLNAPNIGEHIWAVMNILFYCEKYNKENQYLCSIETEGVPYIRPEFPKVAKCNESMQRKGTKQGMRSQVSSMHLIVKLIRKREKRYLKSISRSFGTNQWRVTFLLHICWQSAGKMKRMKMQMRKRRWNCC